MVGARNDDDKGAFAGAIYLYERTASGWLQTAKIIPDDVRALDYFGHAVGISGETIIASANGDDVNRGVVYVFGRDESSGEWQWQATVVADDRSQDDVFGASVAIDGDDILVGATSSDVGGFQSGSAYFFGAKMAFGSRAKKLPHMMVQAKTCSAHLSTCQAITRSLARSAMMKKNRELVRRIFTSTMRNPGGSFKQN